MIWELKVSKISVKEGGRLTRMVIEHRQALFLEAGLLEVDEGETEEIGNTFGKVNTKT
jgi:hypothetical protein